MSSSQLVSTSKGIIDQTSTLIATAPYAYAGETLFLNWVLDEYGYIGAILLPLILVSIFLIIRKMIK